MEYLPDTTYTRTITGLKAAPYRIILDSMGKVNSEPITLYIQGGGKATFEPETLLLSGADASPLQNDIYGMPIFTVNYKVTHREIGWDKFYHAKIGQWLALPGGFKVYQSVDFSFLLDNTNNDNDNLWERMKPKEIGE